MYCARITLTCCTNPQVSLFFILVSAVAPFESSCAVPRAIHLHELPCQTTTIDFSIYHDDIKVSDPSGVQLSGLKNYKNSFKFLQTIVGLFYNLERSSVQHRIVYDFARSSIRISWHATLVPKVVGNRRNSLYFDGYSVYKLDATSGKIIEHRVENLLINNIPATPPYGILSVLQGELTRDVERVPAGVGAI
mmetsp:Transcript_13631/g.19993  ORF Transcript_13631/g.19993 Transcript_13631/m.19993 type:complete len:192 (-) Transcript_13631:177-752(-)